MLIKKIIRGPRTINNITFLEEQPLEREIYNRINENFSEVSEKIINPSLWYK